MNKSKMTEIINTAWTELEIAVEKNLDMVRLLDKALEASIQSERDHRRFMGRHGSYLLSVPLTAKYFVLKHVYNGSSSKYVLWKDVSQFRTDILLSISLHHHLKDEGKLKDTFSCKDFSSIKYATHIAIGRNQCQQ